MLVFVAEAELGAEFLASMGGENFIKPRGAGSFVFASHDFYDVAMF